MTLSKLKFNLHKMPIDPSPRPEDENNISKEELFELDNDGTGLQDDANLVASRLDGTDNDGEPLNENSDDISGEDLDVGREDFRDYEDDLSDKEQDDE